MKSLIARVKSDKYDENQTTGATEFSFSNTSRDSQPLQEGVQHFAASAIVIAPGRDKDFMGGDLVEVTFRKLSDDEVKAFLSPTPAIEPSTPTPAAPVPRT